MSVQLINLRKIISAVIANGASLSNVVTMDGYRVLAIEMPAAWTAANLTFQGSNDGSTYQNLYDDLGSEITVIADAARNIPLLSDKALALMSFAFIKIRSGTSGTPVNQGAARTVGVVAGV